MQGKIIDFYYFSGTGNTLLAVKAMREVFEKNGDNVNLFKIEKSSADTINLKHILGLAFPVTCWSTFPFIWNFLKALPKTSGTKVFAINTFAGSSGGLNGALKKLLSGKGFVPVGVKGIRMPSNIFYIYPEKYNQNITNTGIKVAQNFAKDIINEQSRWDCPSFISSATHLFSKILLSTWKIKSGQKLFQYRLNKTKCTKCGLCAKLCPVKNIIMDNYPIRDIKCEYCMRCASFCPAQAIKVPFNFKHKTYKAVSSAKEMIINE